MLNILIVDKNYFVICTLIVKDINICFCVMSTNSLVKFNYRHNFEKNIIKEAKSDDFESFYCCRFFYLLQVLKVYSSHYACLIFVYSVCVCVFFNFTFLIFIIWLIVISIIKSHTVFFCYYLYNQSWSFVFV